MLYYTNSKVFQNSFLRNESYQDILNCQYVLVSSRIYSSGGYENIVQARNMLYPNPEVCSTMSDETFRDRYFNQLETNKAFFATLIKGCIEEKYNILFLNTSKEEKHMKYLRYLSEFIFLNFGYPCYNYKYYSMGVISLIKYNKRDVLKICNDLLKDARDNYNRNPENKLNKYKKMSKKKLRNILKKEGLYLPGMDKEEMLESVRLFI